MAHYQAKQDEPSPQVKNTANNAQMRFVFFAFVCCLSFLSCFLFCVLPTLRYGENTFFCLHISFSFTRFGRRPGYLGNCWGTLGGLLKNLGGVSRSILNTFGGYLGAILRGQTPLVPTRWHNKVAQVLGGRSGGVQMSCGRS